jgi:hypothetical protein
VKLESDTKSSTIRRGSQTHRLQLRLEDVNPALAAVRRFLRVVRCAKQTQFQEVSLAGTRKPVVRNKANSRVADAAAWLCNTDFVQTKPNLGAMGDLSRFLKDLDATMDAGPRLWPGCAVLWRDRR